MSHVFRLTLLSQEEARTNQLVRGWATLPEALREKIVVTGFSIKDIDRAPNRVRSALASTDLLILSHVLVDDDAARAAEAIDGYLRPQAHVLVLYSLRSLLLKTRIGGFSPQSAIAKFSSGAMPPVPAIAAFAKLFGADDMTPVIRELRTKLPDLLRSIPPFLADLESFVFALAAWSEPTPENLGRLIHKLADRYGPEKGTLASPPTTIDFRPIDGLYHANVGIVDDVTRLPRPIENAPPVAVLLVRGAVLAGDHAVHDAWIAACEERGLRPIPIFSDSFDFRGAIDRFAVPARAVAVLNATGFPLVGGHNRSSPDEASRFLSERNLIYFTPTGLLVQDLEGWEKSSLGLSPIETAMQPAVHELEGGIEPLMTHGTLGGERTPLLRRIEKTVDRLARRIALRKKPNDEKRVLLTIFAFPPGKGSVGTAAYLDVMRSACAILARLKIEGYRVELPSSPEELLGRIVDGDQKTASIATAELAVGDRLSVPLYERLVKDHRRAEKVFGPAPGNLNSDGRNLLIHGTSCGNVFVGVQPSFGYEGDPMRLLFSKDAAPHHGFLAFYAWAEHVFGADAIVHLGTHGALEFMPGKQVGLSDRCWPDQLIGDLPNVYLYAVNNPAEGTIAKRRGYATTIGHLVPPADQAGLARHLAEMKLEIQEFRESADRAPRRRVAEILLERVRAIGLDRDCPTIDAVDGADDETVERFIGRLYSVLIEIETRRIPVGLHVVGKRPTRAERLELLAAIGEEERPEDGIVSARMIGLGLDSGGVRALDQASRFGDSAATDRFRAESETWRRIVACMLESGESAALSAWRDARPDLDLSAATKLLGLIATVDASLDRSDELTPLVHALSGGYTPPAPGGDPVRAPNVLPTGKNIHGLDPAHVPSAAALRRGREVIDLLLARRRRELGRWPESIGLVLWGLDNVKSHGESIAQALWLLGVLPKKNSIGRTTELEIVPLPKLGRPRIDVLLSVSGIFRDIFGSHMEMLDRAVRMVAALDEPVEWNFVKLRTERIRSTGRFDADAAASRVFSNSPGHYGAHIDHMVQMSLWQERGELADLFARRKGYAFGNGQDGVDRSDLFSELAGGVDTTFQNLDSSEVSILDVDHYFEYLGGLTALAEKKSGKRPDVVIADATAALPRLRTLDETVRLEARTKLLNPKWQEGMLAHGYEGVEEIKKRLDYTFGWSATCEAVDAWIYRDAHRAFIEDDDLRDRMQKANVHAFSALVHRLIEADDRGFWAATKDEKDRLHALAEDIEDAIEGVR